jgi:hypothetical protein
VLGTLASDSIYVALQLRGAYRAGGPLDGAWLLVHLLWGAAAQLAAVQDRLGRGHPGVPPVLLGGVRASVPAGPSAGINRTAERRLDRRVGPNR